MNKIREEQKQINENCIQDFQLEETDEEDLLKINEYLLKDNTNDNMIITYLDLKKKKNETDFKEEVKRYSYFLNKDIVNKKYGQYYTKRYSSIELFFAFYEKILNFSNKMTVQQKIEYFENLIIVKDTFDYKMINNYVSFDNNKELYIFLQLYNIVLCIKNQIRNFKDGAIDENNDLIRNLRKEIQDLEIYKKVKKYYENINTKTIDEPSENEIKIYKKLLQAKAKINIEQNINELKDNILYISKISSKSFDKYFENLLTFFKVIKNKFYKRFLNLENSNNKEDIELFNDFCFFVCEFNFCKLSNQLINIWFYSLEQTKQEVEVLLKSSSSEGLISYTIEDNALILKTIYNDDKNIIIYKIKNIDNYVIENIIDYLYLKYQALLKRENDRKMKESILSKIYNFFFYYINFFNKYESQYNKEEIAINEYEIEKYLKLNKYKSELFITKNYNCWKSYLIKIFSSKTIRTAFEKICKEVCTDFKPYDFINDKELNTIFNEIKFFQFPIKNCFGMTLIDTLEIHEYYKGLNKDYEEDISKILSLTFNVVTNEHEILGHLNIRIQNLINRKEVKSPKPNLGNNNLIERDETESGDYIEELLYGKTISSLTYKEMLFILDIGNYNCSYDEFKKKFINCNNSLIKISNDFLKLIKSLNIKISNDIDNSEDYTIGQKLSKAKEKEFKKPLQHRRGAVFYSTEFKMKLQRQSNQIMELLKKLKKE